MSFTTDAVVHPQPKCYADDGRIPPTGMQFFCNTCKKPICGMCLGDHTRGVCAEWQQRAEDAVRLEIIAKRRAELDRLFDAAAENGCDYKFDLRNAQPYGDKDSVKRIDVRLQFHFVGEPAKEVSAALKHWPEHWRDRRLFG